MKLKATRTPYRMINKLWYDLLEDENDHASRFTDEEIHIRFMKG